MNHKTFGHLLSAIVRCLFSLSVAIGALDALPSGSALAAPPAPDLVVTKTDSPDPVLVGNNLTYTVTVRNQGSGKAYSVVMTDTLPVSATLVAVSTTRGACSRLAGQVVCSLRTLNKNGIARVTIITRPTAAGVITNTATASTTSADANPANNTASAATTVNARTDLSITKTDVTDPVHVGDPLGYTLVVSNAGPLNATGVVVTDTLASSLTFVSASPGCVLSGRSLICTIGALAASGNRTITVTVTPTAAAAGTLFNMAVVGGNETDSNSTNNVATVSTTVLPKTDLSVEQSSTPTPALLGNLLTYAVVVANHGPSAATGVVLTDTLPAGVTLASAPAGCSQLANVVTCAIGALTGGSSVTTTLTVTPAATVVIANGVSVTGNEFDPNVTNNSNSLSTTVVPAADLSLTQTRAPALVLVGDTLTYTLVLTNSGPSDATNVVLTDTLQGHVTFNSATPSQGNCSVTSVVVCTLGTLGHGTTATLTVVAKTKVEEVITSTATVTSDVADPFLANNTTTLRTAVNPVDLSVSKVGSPALVMAGQRLTYTLVVTNNGPLTGTNIVLTDSLPANVTLASTDSGPSMSCAGTSTIVCSMDTMDVGTAATVTIAVTPTASGMIVNTASVTADEPDPDPTNNTATATNGVNPVDLELVKTAAPNPAHSGDLITFTLTITNHGPSNAAGVVTDTLPGNMTLGSTSDGCSYSTVVVCRVDAPANGSARTLTITARLASDATGIITNTAVVASIEPDTVPANNTAQISIAVSPQADLRVDKISVPPTVYVGDSLTYLVMVNNYGPSAATNVVITDVLPGGIAFNWALPACTPSGGTVICNMGAVASGDSASAMIVVTPTAAAARTVTNTVTVRGDQFDPNITNNRTTATTLVLAKADVVVSKKATPDPAQSGRSLVYTVVVTNTGPSLATGVLITDTLPDGVTFGSAPGCGQAGSVVTCALGSIAGGQSKTVNITVTPLAATAGTFIDNIVEASANEFDPDLNSNMFVLSTAVDPADLAIAKTATPASLLVGKTLTYTLVVTNTGASNVTGVLVHDSLPDNMTLKSAAPGCALDVAAGIVTCDLADMNTGVSKAVTLTVVPTASGLITNTASVDANEADGNLANNTSSVTTRVKPIYTIYLPLILR